MHNIEVAPRVASLELGDTVEFKGEYIWNEEGGLIHWTHRDPGGGHEPGGSGTTAGSISEAAQSPGT